VAGWHGSQANTRASVCTACVGGSYTQAGQHTCVPNKTSINHYLNDLLLSRVSGNTAALGHSLNTQSHTTHPPKVAAAAAAAVRAGVYGAGVAVLGP
jgi:hypothetical protein